MDPEIALAILKEVVSYVFSQQQQQKQAAQMNQLLNNLDVLTGLINALQDVIKQTIADNQIGVYNSQLVNAKLYLANGDLQTAAGLARASALGLTAPNLQLRGFTSFLAAAGVDITIRQRMGSSAINDLRQTADTYRTFAMNTAPLIKDAVSQRIRTVDYPLSHITQYQIDGTTSSIHPTLDHANEYYTNKKAVDTLRLAAPILYPLYLAAESWAAIAENRAPEYGHLFQGWIVTPATPGYWALVVPQTGTSPTQYKKLNYAVAAAIKDISIVFGVIPDEAFQSIPDLGVIPEGTKAVGSVNSSGVWIRPGALVIQPVGAPPPGTPIAQIDDRRLADDNNSVFTMIDAADYDQHYGTWCQLQSYKYDK